MFSVQYDKIFVLMYKLYKFFQNKKDTPSAFRIRDILS